MRIWYRQLYAVVVVALIAYVHIYMSLTPSNRPVTWGIAAIVKDESPYLEEWLRHHIAITKASQILLYDNNVNASESRITHQLARKWKSVEVIPWHHYDDVYELPYVPIRVGSMSPLAVFAARYGYNRQQFAYLDSLTRVKVDWLQLLDIDEFVICTDPVKYYGRYTAGVRVPRYDFGSNGIVNPPTVGGVRGSYLRREAVPSNYKEAGRVQYVTGNPYSSHRWSYRFPLRASPGSHGMSIFHYKSKSKDEYLRRKIHDTAAVGDRAYTDVLREYLSDQQRTNDVLDTRAASSSPSASRLP
jgi:hypothetical protein